MIDNPIDKYLLAKPSVRGIFEWFILIASGFYGYYLSILPLPSRYSIISGIIFLILGISIHGLSHKEHKQAHSKAEEIEKIVTTGIYSKIRHPGYLGLILMNFGLAFCFCSLIPVIVTIILSTLYILTALREEKYLLKKFEKEYGEYMRRVQWRFIPRVF